MYSWQTRTSRNQARDLFIQEEYTMPAIEKKNLNQPEETNRPEKLKMESSYYPGPYIPPGHHRTRMDEFIIPPSLPL
jgi:hypothetical protein